MRQQLTQSSETGSTTFETIARSLSNSVQSLQSILTFKSDKGDKNGLPLHERTSPNTRIEAQQSPTQVVHTELLFLLLCCSEKRYATKLFQLDLITQGATSDKALFELLRLNYNGMRGRWLRLLSLRTRESIKFVHFEMYRSSLVDVRKINDIPPSGNIDYRYQPAPPDIIPPVGENHLKHIFLHPNHAEDEPICLNRFPKKLKEKL